MESNFLLRIFIITGIVLLSCNNDEDSPPQNDYIQIEVIASGFEIPFGIEIIDENEFLFSDRVGILYHYDNGSVDAIDGIPSTVSVTSGGLVFGGLMDVSLHPEYEANRLVYIAYVSPDYQLKVARFRLNNNSVNNFEIIFRANEFSIGSRIVWQDNDHFFVSLGVGGSPYPEPGPQDLNDDRGKIHRLMADGQIPEDNPIFPGFSSPTSIWTYGHRNPQGLFYRSSTATLYANEHGPLGGDELNIIEKGGNYGWPLYSNGLNYDNTPVSEMTESEAGDISVLPIKYWTHNYRIAPSGLVLLEDSQFSSWNNSFLMGALLPQNLLRYDARTDVTEILLEEIGRVRDVAQLPSGNLLILIDEGSPNTSVPGRILKLSPK